ncbi:hypothetical protein SCA6_006121 [Theobroma cacao]
MKKKKDNYSALPSKQQDTMLKSRYRCMIRGMLLMRAINMSYANSRNLPFAISTADSFTVQKYVRFGYQKAYTSL